MRRLAQRLVIPIHLHILIVDPDVGGAQQLANALSSTHAVTVVGTASAAFAAIQKRIPRLVVTEFDLPDTSALELLAILHAHPAIRQVLLVVLSRRTNVQNKIAAFQAGADDFLVKPIVPQTFAAHLQRLGHFRMVLALGDA